MHPAVAEFLRLAKLALKPKGLNQKQFAAKIGYSESYVCQVLKFDVAHPNDKFITKVSELLSLEAPYSYTTDGKPADIKGRNVAVVPPERRGSLLKRRLFDAVMSALRESDQECHQKCHENVERAVTAAIREAWAVRHNGKASVGKK